jgi:predicted Zn finger-like uncharacterized protein
MKFLCPQCKAKYKIADTKVANRATPRMKCRKCGHVIDIKAASAAVDVTDSVLPPPPAPNPRKATVKQWPPRPKSSPLHRSPPRARTPEPAIAAAPAPAQEFGGGFDDEPTVVDLRKQGGLGETLGTDR